MKRLIVSCMLWHLLLLLSSGGAGVTDAFVVVVVVQQTRRHQTADSSSTTTTILRSTAVATLTDSTTWKLRLVFDNFPQVEEESIVLEGKFLEDQGYEPPQGSFESEQISQSRWQLSEDPSDRKDGLWIWGLFSEPLYPFLLLQLELKDNVVVYAQVGHRRKDGGRVELGVADLTVRNYENIRADPFGAAKVDVYEEQKIGRISFFPESSSSSSQ